MTTINELLLMTDAKILCFKLGLDPKAEVHYSPMHSEHCTIDVMMTAPTLSVIYDALKQVHALGLMQGKENSEAKWDRLILEEQREGE